VISSSAPESDVARAIAAVEAVALVRDLANTPPLDLYPEAFADRAVELAAPHPIEVTVWDEHRLAEDGFGGILGVGMGSTRPPRLVKLVYRPEGASTHLALVGKGITFDTGGLSLKPPTSMVGMKYDMTGAATALAVIIASAKLEVPVALTAWLCLAENMPSGGALRPNDVLTIRGGTTVEVLNTDAEGRLVMADGLVAASEEFPDAIIDIATLTGAAKVALGDRYIAVMGNDDFAGRVIEAADRSGESFWALPLPEEMRSWLNSDIADLTNVKIGNTAGGALVAGVFLKEFVGRVSGDKKARQISWAHLDIAGAAWNDSPSGYLVKGPTGVAVRALLGLTRSLGPA
jgi:leucyl aminopeptidase